jgi:hypothetical protein
MFMRTLLLTVHISSGTLGLLTGPLAMLVPKRRGWHQRIGRIYQLSVALICGTAIGLAVLQPALWWFGVIAAATWAAALGGWQVRRRRPPGWLPWHISLMCGSYISLLTALFVVNLGVRAVVAWVLPTVVGSPLIAWAAYRAATGRYRWQANPRRPAAGPGEVLAAPPGEVLAAPPGEVLAAPPGEVLAAPPGW